MEFIVCNTTFSPLGDGGRHFQSERAPLPNEKPERQDYRKKAPPTRDLTVAATYMLKLVGKGA